jgi:hypothetical protein
VGSLRRVEFSFKFTRHPELMAGLVVAPLADPAATGGIGESMAITNANAEIGELKAVAQNGRPHDRLAACWLLLAKNPGRRIRALIKAQVRTLLPLADSDTRLAKRVGELTRYLRDAEKAAQNGRQRVLGHIGAAQRASLASAAQPLGEDDI